jgi:hypothetical protein
MAQSAPGTWPAFWLLAKKPEDRNNNKTPGDELDIIEGYGGWGPHNPNSANYNITTHFWGQPKPDWTLEKGPDGKPLKSNHATVPMLTLGGNSSWSTTFHTYAVKITDTDTIYYFDNIEVLRHPSGDYSKNQPLWFMVNYAIGGISGWHIDLNRYGNQSDMWVDYVRVYQGQQ